MHFAVPFIDPALAELIRAQSDGNPGIAIQLAISLDNDGHVVVDETGGRLRRGFQAESLAIPENVEGLILSLIDNLSTGQALHMKLISVLGSHFTVSLLSQCMEESYTECLAQVNELIAAGAPPSPLPPPKPKTTALTADPPPTAF